MYAHVVCNFETTKGHGSFNAVNDVNSYLAKVGDPDFTDNFMTDRNPLSTFEIVKKKKDVKPMLDGKLMLCMSLLSSTIYPYTTKFDKLLTEIDDTHFLLVLEAKKKAIRTFVNVDVTFPFLILYSNLSPGADDIAKAFIESLEFNDKQVIDDDVIDEYAKGVNQAAHAVVTSVLPSVLVNLPSVKKVKVAKVSKKNNSNP